VSAGVPELRQIGSSHPDVRRALAAHRGRERAKLLICGIWEHRAALDADVGVDAFFCAPEAVFSDEGHDLARAMAARSRSSYRVSTKIIERLADRDRIDGLASIIDLPRWQHDQLQLGADPLIVVSDGLASPGNLGTVIRTMDACAADLLIMINQRTRTTTGTVFESSRGRSLTVPQLSFDTVEEAISWLGARSVRIRVTDPNAGQPYTRTDWSGPIAIVLGNERYGVSDGWRHCDRVQIPMLGRADSLNVAVSAGVLLFHARAQRDRW
jgi:TrmH family RNA methyltransferase